MINVVYIGNSKMFDQVFLNVISILRRTKEIVNFRFLTMDFSFIKSSYLPFSSERATYLDNYVKTYNPQNSFSAINVEKYYTKYFINNKNTKSSYSPYIVLRLLLDVIPDIPDKILYLDCDTMASGDINELYSMDISTYEYAATLDFLGKTWINKNYVNSGVLLLNIKMIKETKLFEVARKQICDKWMKFPDQTPLNENFKSRLVFRDTFRFNEQRGVKKDTIIKHFCQGIKWLPFFYVYNIKQDNEEKVHRVLHIDAFDEDYKIYNALKEQLNKTDKAKYDELNKEYIIQVYDLKKSYGDIQAVNNISFNVRRGSLFAFLGVNGAGKSTTINIISSILSKDGGKVFIDGYDLDKHSNSIKREIGIVFQSSVLDGVLTVKENLASRATFYNLPKEQVKSNLNEIIKMLNLGPILNQQVRKLSGGQKRRVDIARSMVHMPKILILDEPTTGLDPKTRSDVWNLISTIRTETNMTVFLTTHYLEEADQATDVVIMDHGNIIAKGTPTELKNKYAKDSIIVYAKKTELYDEAFKDYKYKYDVDSNSYEVYIDGAQRIKEFLFKFSDIIKDFEVKKGKMDNVFLNVTQNPEKYEKEYENEETK